MAATRYISKSCSGARVADYKWLSGHELSSLRFVSVNTLTFCLGITNFFLTAIDSKMSLKERLTVIITTSPIRSHPSTEMIMQVRSSFALVEVFKLSSVFMPLPYSLSIPPPGIARLSPSNHR
jgi:hypothetical protein